MNTLPQLTHEVYSRFQTMPNERYRRYLAEVERGMITQRHHPENPDLVILNYTDRAAYEREWNAETLSARGLILDTKDLENGVVYIVSKGMDKFFNFGENPDYEADIDFDSVESVTEKLDGSLGISYYFNGEIRFATRGSFTSDQALRATQMWKDEYPITEDRYFDLFLHSDKPLPTLLVEIIYPDNRVVVDYGEAKRLALVAVLRGEEDWNAQNVQFVADWLGLPTPRRTTQPLNVLTYMKTKLTANQEGWVVKFENGKRLKIKGDEYIRVHKLLYGLSNKAKAHAWASGQLDTYIAELPDEFRHDIEQTVKWFNLAEHTLTMYTTQLFRWFMRTAESRKDYARLVGTYVEPKYHGFLFRAYDLGYVPPQLVKDFVAARYTEYLPKGDPKDDPTDRFPSVDRLAGEREVPSRRADEPAGR